MTGSALSAILPLVMAVHCVLLPTAPELTETGHQEVPRPFAPIDSAARTVGWKLLASLGSRRGIVPPELMALQGKRVRVPGFVVPLEDLNSDVKEFLLVPYYGACVHTPPPPPNQMVFVQLATKTKVALFDAVWIEGMLEIIKVESPYGVVGYRLQGQKLTPYQTSP